MKAVDNDWRLRGACLTGDPDLFFPISSGGPGQARTEQARRICRGCPVRAPCLDWAIDVGVSDGIWGGLDAPERRSLQRRRESGQRSTAAASTPFD